MLKQNHNKGTPSSSTSSQSLEALYKIDSRLKKYPSTLNFYLNPPQEQINLLEFEECALGRLSVLLAIESARLRARSDQDIMKLIEPALTKHMELKNNILAGTKAGIDMYKQRQRDHFSHFILRLAFCKTTELQAWLIKQELALFRLRFNSISKEERDHLVKQANLEFSPCTHDQLIDTIVKEGKKFKGAGDRSVISTSIKAVYGECPLFFKVPFEHVIELVQRREVIMISGFAYLRESEQIVLILDWYKTHLESQLKMTAKGLPGIDEEDRLIPVLNALAKHSSSGEYQISGNGNEFRAEDVEKLVEHFPPCMRVLQSTLSRDSHLKHNGRIQFGLFLKGIGISLEEAMIFWRRAFSKMNDDEYQKKGYVYNIRYNYGMEGKRTNYTPYSCMKMISSPAPGPGESHGCPFRYFSNEKLSELMSDGYGLDMATTHSVVQKAKEGHYQLACTRLFELTKGKVHEEAEMKRKMEGGESLFTKDSDGNTVLFDPINHPNRYFDLSYKGKSGKFANTQREDIIMD